MRENRDKALWRRNWKFGKIPVIVLWVTTLFALPINYTNHARLIFEWSVESPTYFEYHFWFSSTNILWLAGIAVVSLACLLMGWERQNQGLDTMLAFPFKKRDIVLSKWWFGGLHITLVTLVNLSLMFFVHTTTIHGEYASFTPFLWFFANMFLGLLTIYTIALFMGLLAGNITVQFLLTFVAAVLPFGLMVLVEEVASVHGFHNVVLGMEQFIGEITIIRSLFGTFNWMQQVGADVTHLLYLEHITVYNDIVFSNLMPSLTHLVALGVYLLVAFVFIFFFANKLSGERNGRIIAFQQIEGLFLWSVSICTGLTAGTITTWFFWGYYHNELPAFYIGSVLAGVCCYLLLSKWLMRKTFRKG